MEALSRWFSETEKVIRHLLTGAAVCAIWLLSLAKADRDNTIAYAERSPVLALVFVVAAGTAAYSLFRISAWCVLDGIAWVLKCSAPSIFIEFVLCGKNGARSYARPYVWFLRQRHSDEVEEKVSNYLYYRWAVTHFAAIFAIALFIAASYCKDDSFVKENGQETWFIGGFAAVAALWQYSFLYRLEKEYFTILRDRLVPPRLKTRRTRPRSSIGWPVL